MAKTSRQRVEVKNRDKQLKYILENEFELSPRESESIVKTANEIYELENYEPSHQADRGKIIRTVISKDARHGPRLEDLPKVNVTLTKDIQKEDKDLYRQEGKTSLRQAKILRMTNEALEQGGLLTQEDLADILEVSVRTVRRDIKKLETRSFDVPTRGVYQDIGPGVSHKTKIIKLHLEYHTYSEIQRKTRHSPTAIKRYITSFGRVLLSIRNDLSTRQTAHIVGISEKLVKEYTEIYLQYNTDEYQERLADIVNLAESKAAVRTAAKKGAPK